MFSKDCFNIICHKQCFSIPQTPFKMGITFSNPKILKDVAEIINNFTTMFEIRYSKE